MTGLVLFYRIDKNECSFDDNYVIKSILGNSLIRTNR